MTAEQLAKSNEYYHTIHPTEAAEVDARLAEEKAKAEAKAKAAADAAAAKAAAAAAQAAKRLFPRLRQWMRPTRQQILRQSQTEGESKR